MKSRETIFRVSGRKRSMSWLRPKNVLAAFGEDLGHYAERILRKRLEAARFFLENLQEPLSENIAKKTTKAGRRTIRQLLKLLEAIDQVVERPQPTEAQPVYDRMNLALAVRSAAGAFQEEWRPILGLESKPGFVKEHWTRVKALNRRLAAMGKGRVRTLYDRLPTFVGNCGIVSMCSSRTRCIGTATNLQRKKCRPSTTPWPTI